MNVLGNWTADDSKRRDTLLEWMRKQENALGVRPNSLYIPGPTLRELWRPAALSCDLILITDEQWDAQCSTYSNPYGREDHS